VDSLFYHQGQYSSNEKMKNLKKETFESNDHLMSCQQSTVEKQPIEK